MKYLIGIVLVLLAACQPATPPTLKTSSALLFQKLDIAVGVGDELVAGKTAVVHYTGWLFDPGAPENKGTKFDSSRDRGEPFRFAVGSGQVIKGWDEGVVGMRIGGQRRLIIPPEMGYGARGAGSSIPPNAALLFDVELLTIE